MGIWTIIGVIIISLIGSIGISLLALDFLTWKEIKKL